jgi:hypothetical protein
MKRLFKLPYKLTYTSMRYDKKVVVENRMWVL